MATGVSFSDYWANKLGELTIRSVALSAPAALWVALYTDATPLTGSGGGTEVSTAGTGYARKQITEPRTTSFSAFVLGASANLLLINFGTATTSWGNLQYLSLMDASSAGNMIMYGIIAGAPIATVSSQPVSIPVGSLTVLID